MTFADYMEEIYLPYYRQTVQSVTYKTALTHHKMFIEVFGQKRLSAITVRDCEQFRVHLIDTYSPNYAKGVWIRFKQCLGYAERLQIIEEFPCKMLDNPKGSRPDTKFWTLDDFRKVIGTFDLTDYEELHRFTAIWLYFFTGLRVSEGLSLIWSDIDFDRKLLHVQSTLEYEGKGVYTRKNQTKTEAGFRWIELDDETVEVLQRWKKMQVENGDNSYILARFGKPLSKCTLSRILKRQAKKAGVEVITGKGLRHSHDSFLINVLGKDVLYVSQRSGRVDKATTLNTYSHLYDSQIFFFFFPKRCVVFYTPKNLKNYTIFFYTKNATGGREITQALYKFGVSSNPTKSPLN